MYLVYEKNFYCDKEGKVVREDVDVMEIWETKEEAINDMQERKELYIKDTEELGFIFSEEESTDNCLIFNDAFDDEEIIEKFHIILAELNTTSERTYTAKRTDEEWGDCYFTVTVPNSISEKEVLEKLTMAAKYSHVVILDLACADKEEYADELTEYDEYFDEMVAYRESSNGDDTFVYYLTKICGYEVESYLEPKVDFKFEW